jgi:hypothetical protein
MQGPYFHAKNAAEFCGMAPSTFREEIRGANLPRYGPKRNKCAATDLDAWMRDPTVFMRPRRQSQPRKGGLFR